MAQMFCTLKQAADRLETTEAEIEILLNDGILREFRDGSTRLLKVADLAALALATTTSATTGGRSAQVRGKARLPRSGHDDDAIVLPNLEIKLPAAAAVTTRTSPRVAPPKRPTRQPAGHKRVPPVAASRHVPTQRRQGPPRAVVISPSIPERSIPKTYEMSLRQWLWTGLLDDDPLAIFIVFGAALLGISAVAGAVYLLAQAL